jgi:hypothetical protein
MALQTFSTKLLKTSNLVTLAASLAVGSAVVGFSVNPAQAVVSGFTGLYAPAKWIETVNPDGYVDTANAPASITLGSANNEGGAKQTNYTITAPAAGKVSFDWLYKTFDVDGSGLGPFGYLLNGNYTQLSINNLMSDQTGSVAFDVLLGDTFGFSQRATDSALGRGITTVSNFNAPAPVPAPLPLLGVGASIAWSRRLRKRVALGSNK